MRARRVVLLGVTVALLAACGGSGGSDGSATESAGEAELTPATAGLTVDDPGPGEALQAFVEAAAAEDAATLWALLSPASQARLGPTVEDFARRLGADFRDGLGTFAGTDYEVVISRRDERDEGGWGVAAVAGNRVREGNEEFAAYGAALREDGGRWLLELGAPIELRRLDHAPPGTIQIEMEADAEIEGAGLWLDGDALPARVQGRLSDLVVEGRLPSEIPAGSVVVTFARTDADAAAGAFPLHVGVELDEDAEPGEI